MPPFKLMSLSSLSSPEKILQAPDLQNSFHQLPHSLLEKTAYIDMTVPIHCFKMQDQHNPMVSFGDQGQNYKWQQQKTNPKVLQMKIKTHIQPRVSTKRYTPTVSTPNLSSEPMKKNTTARVLFLFYYIIIIYYKRITSL